VVDVEQTETDCLEKHVDAAGRRHDVVERQHGVEVERCRQHEPAERHTQQHVRYTDLYDTHATQCRHSAAQCRLSLPRAV